ncbi:MAG: tellurite resistance TerB family protein [Planctomycetota bacterium]|jgi:hypothetical protein
MGRLHQFRSELLRDRKITENEVQVVRDYIREDGKLDLDDVKFLVELLSEADEVCPAFDELLFPALKEVVLADGQIGMDEQYYMLKMLYSDGHIRDSEKRFLMELRRDAQQLTPEFEALCAEAMKADPTDWNVGGR